MDAPQDPLTQARMWVGMDPLRFQRYNPAQAKMREALRNLNPDALTLLLVLKPNGVGGTWGLVGLWSAIMFGTRHPSFAGAPYGAAWPFLKSARVLSTATGVSDRGPIQAGMKNLFPVGAWTQQRGMGKPYYSEGTAARVGWDWDMMTYNQDAGEAAGGNKGVIFCSEPPPPPLFVEALTRLRGRGLAIVEMTQLDEGEWAEDLADDGAYMLDGKKVGEVRVLRPDIEENCRDCYPPDPANPLVPCGTRPHSAIQADIASWPVEERDARRTGKPLRRAGRVYPMWGEAHELDVLPKYHQECWDQGHVRVVQVTNPHDRPPWPIAWAAAFPNRDLVWFAEWPPFPWHECKSSPVTHHEDYRALILEAEAQMPPVVRRVMDPLFGEAINTQSGFNLFAAMGGACRRCAGTPMPRETAREEVAQAIRTSCPHSIAYEHGVAFPGSVNAGHTLVRAALGDPAAGVRPKMYALKGATPNLCHAMRKYAYRENKDKTRGLSETPQYVNKEVADLPRLALLSKLDEWPAEIPPLPRLKMPFDNRGRGTMGIGR